MLYSTSTSWIHRRLGVFSPEKDFRRSQEVFYFGNKPTRGDTPRVPESGRVFGLSSCLE
jgi:hypothetical protein